MNGIGHDDVSGASVCQPESKKVSEKIDEKKGADGHVKEVGDAGISVNRRQNHLKYVSLILSFDIKEIIISTNNKTDYNVVDSDGFPNLLNITKYFSFT
jgi:hypothetical protein